MPVRAYDSGAAASVDMPSGPGGGADPSTSDSPGARGPTGVSLPLERPKKHGAAPKRLLVVG